MTGAPNETLAAARPGTVLCGKYRVLRELARGGMGTVVIASHLKLDRLVAIKLLDASGTDRAYVSARFLREAKAAARLVGDNVVRILDLDETPDGTPFLVMELLDGRDLSQVLLAEGKIAPGRAVDWALQACAALAEAHACGIVHRDVKPANLLLLQRLDGSEQIKLLDFGISKLLSDELQLTRTAATLGSPLFMSPEQLLTPGLVDPRSDVWSLGVTLYKLLSGASPFDAADASALAAQIAARPPMPLADVAPGLPAPLVSVVMRSLEKDASQRWPSIVEFADALEPFRGAGTLGSARLVHLAHAQATLKRSVAPEPTPVAAEPASSWTLSHDVPKPDAPPVLPERSRGASVLLGIRTSEKEASTPLGQNGAVSINAATPRANIGAVIFVGLILVIGVGLTSLSPKPEPRPVDPPPVTAAMVDPKPAALVPPEVSRDAGVVARARPVKPAPDPTKDPSELELK